VVRPIDLLDIQGFKVPQGYYIHRGHAWAKIEENSSVRVGIDDFALRVLGPLDHIESPLLGKEVKQDRAAISLSRGTHRARVLSPVNGVVTSTNANLMERGNLANQDPYSEGWVMTVHSTDLRRDFKNLLMGSETRDFMEEEVDRLYLEIEEVLGPLAVDGGHIGHDIFGQIPQIGWNRLTGLFLRT
jgi:glycine cleavage system H lipoate-binding protein